MADAINAGSRDGVSTGASADTSRLPWTVDELRATTVDLASREPARGAAALELALRDMEALPGLASERAAQEGSVGGIADEDAIAARAQELLSQYQPQLAQYVEGLQAVVPDAYRSFWSTAELEATTAAHVAVRPARGELALSHYEQRLSDVYDTAREDVLRALVQQTSGQIALLQSVESMRDSLTGRASDPESSAALRSAALSDLNALTQREVDARTWLSRVAEDRDSIIAEATADTVVARNPELFVRAAELRSALPERQFSSEEIAQMDPNDPSVRFNPAALQAAHIALAASRDALSNQIRGQVLQEIEQAGEIAGASDEAEQETDRVRAESHRDVNAPNSPAFIARMQQVEREFELLLTLHHIQREDQERGDRIEDLTGVRVYDMAPDLVTRIKGIEEAMTAYERMTAKVESERELLGLESGNELEKDLAERHASAALGRRHQYQEQEREGHELEREYP